MMYIDDQSKGETMTKITKIEAIKVNTTKKIRVAAYARVSTDSDEQLLSLETQKAHYENYIKANPDWTFAGLYYDEGISGTKVAKRESLLHLLDDCEKGKIDRVITKSISRFARNTTDCLEMVRRLSKLNISIFFEKENIDTAHMSSELMLSILSSIAEGESRSISENIKWSVKNRFKDGTYVIGYPPYGYRNQNGKMEIVPEEAKVVKEIFSMSLSGKGCHFIADELNRMGVPSRHGSLWHASTILTILKNEKYTGDALFQKTWTDASYNRHTNCGEEGQYLYKNHHEPIISHEDFEKSTQAMAQRGREKGSVAGEEKHHQRYCFSGKIVCGQCGSSFKRSIQYKEEGNCIIWVCNTHIKNPKDCSIKSIKDKQIKDAFVRMMQKLHISCDVLLKPFVSSLRGYDNKEKLQQILDLEGRIEKCEEQKQILTQLLSSGYIEPEIFYKEKRELDLQGTELSKEKAQISGVLNGDLKHLASAERLLKAVSKNEVEESFNEELFTEHVSLVTVLSRNRVGFNLKCGLQLEEEFLQI